MALGVIYKHTQILCLNPTFFSFFPLTAILPKPIMHATNDEGELKDVSSQEIENVDATETAASTSEEKALVRKIDLTLLPTIWVMYLLSYLDRTK